MKPDHEYSFSAPRDRVSLTRIIQENAEAQAILVSYKSEGSEPLVLTAIRPDAPGLSAVQSDHDSADSFYARGTDWYICRGDAVAKAVARQTVTVQTY